MNRADEYVITLRPINPAAWNPRFLATMLKTFLRRYQLTCMDVRAVPVPVPAPKVPAPKPLPERSAPAPTGPVAHAPAPRPAKKSKAASAQDVAGQRFLFAPGEALGAPSRPPVSLRGIARRAAHASR